MIYKIGASKYLSVSEAASQLGISASSLRKYTANGLIKVMRHPMSHYRLYRQEDITELLNKISGAQQEETL